MVKRKGGGREGIGAQDNWEGSPPRAFVKKPRGTIHRHEEGIPFAGRVFGEMRLISGRSV